MSAILDQAHSFGCKFAMEQHDINLDDVDVEFLREALTSDQGLLEALGSSSTSEDVGSRKENVENFVDTAFDIPCHQPPFKDISNPSVDESAILDEPIQRPVSPVLRSTRRSVRRKVKNRKQDAVKLVPTDALASPISALVNQVQCESPSSLGHQKTSNNDLSNDASDHCATSVHSELFIAQDDFLSSVLQSSKSDTNECFPIEEARTCEKLRDTSRKRPRTPCPNDFNPWKKQANRDINRRRTFSSFGSSLTDLAAKSQAVSNKTTKSSSADDVSAPSAGKQTAGARVQNASDRDTKWHGPPDSAVKSSSSDINGGLKCLEIASVSDNNREVLGTVLNTVEQRCAMTHLHVGFTTASNKPIKPSACALKKAQQICNELMNPVPNPSSPSANSVDLSTVSPTSTTSCKETVQSVKLTTKCCENTVAIQSDAVNTKFSTPNRAVAVQAVSPSGSSNEDTKTSNFRPVCNATVQDVSSVGRSASSTQSTIASFRTASNKTLSVSSAALENAKRILVVDDPVSSNPQQFEYSKSPQTNADCAKQSSTYKRVASTKGVERWSKQKTKSLSDDTVHHVPPSRPTSVKSDISGNGALVTSKNDIGGGRIPTDCGGVDPFADDDALLANYDFTAGDESSSVDDVTSTKCNAVPSAQFGSRCDGASVQQKSCATGFTTASNKTVSVSSTSMAKARALLQETSQHNDVAVKSEQQPAKLSHDSGAKESLQLTLNSKVTADLTDNASARVQRGSNILARVFEATTAGIQRSSTSVSDISTNTNVVSRNVKTKEAVATGFKTASNKILSVTAASLEKAKSMLTDTDTSVPHSEPKRLSCDKETSAIDSSRYSEGQDRVPIASSGGIDNITSVQRESSTPRPQASILTSGASASLTKSVALPSPARSEPRTKLLFGSCTKARRRNSAYKPPRRKTSLTTNVSMKSGGDARTADLSSVPEKKADSASPGSVARRSIGKNLGVKQTHEEQILLSDESLLMAVELFEDI